MLEDFIASLMYIDEDREVNNKYALLDLYEKKREEEINKYYNNKINYDELNKKFKEYNKLKEEELQKLRELITVVKANLAIASNKEEVEEILKRYEILDKNGKMVEI